MATNPRWKMDYTGPSRYRLQSHRKSFSKVYIHCYFLLPHMPYHAFPTIMVVVALLYSTLGLLHLAYPNIAITVLGLC